MWVGAVTLFPEMFNAVTAYGITGRAVKEGILSVELWNPRDFTYDRHRSVDDRPYGGGPGMLMKVEPLRAAIQAARAAAPVPVRTVYLSPQGRPFNQAAVEELASLEGLILIAGRYEGVDERILESEIDDEISLGDFVLSGGELGAMAIIDAVTRLLPGALGHGDSAAQDSFANGLLDCPHYTRPEVFEGRQVPPVLLGGNHQNIRRWRLKQALGRTWQRRPDLIEAKSLSVEERKLLDEFISECDGSGRPGH